MSIIFELWAECQDSAAAQAFKQHFSSLEYTLMTGRTIRWEMSIYPDHPAESIALSGSSDDLSRFGVRTLTDALEATEVGIRLYHHLLSAPDFQFARIDWEARNIPVRDLPEYCEPEPLSLQCVLQEQLFRSFGSPPFFVPFRPGYYWNSYQGAIYRPLYSNDQPALYTLFRELFPRDV